MNKKLALDCLESFIRIQTMCETVAGCQDLIDRLKSEILGEEIVPITDEKSVDKFKAGDKVYCYHYNKYGIVVKVGGSDWGKYTSICGFM